MARSETEHPVAKGDPGQEERTTHDQIRISKPNISFVMSIKELDDLYPTPMEEVHGSQATQFIKNNLINWNNEKELAESVLLNLELSEAKAPEVQERILTLQAKIHHYENKIREGEKRLEQIAQLKAEFKEKLPMPKLGMKGEFDIEQCHLYIPIFSGETDSSSFLETWQKTILFSENNQLSEVAIKFLLPSVLKGLPYFTYWDNKDKPLHEILQILLDRFARTDTIVDKENILNTLERKPTEKLASIMARVALLLDQTKLLLPEYQREVRFDLSMIENLLNFCSKKAKVKIIEQRDKARQSGYHMTYKIMLQLAEEVERSEISPEITSPHEAFPLDLKWKNHNKMHTRSSARQHRSRSPLDRNCNKKGDNSQNYSNRSPSPSPKHKELPHLQSQASLKQTSNAPPPLRRPNSVIGQNASRSQNWPTSNQPYNKNQNFQRKRRPKLHSYGYTPERQIYQQTQNDIAPCHHCRFVHYGPCNEQYNPNRNRQQFSNRRRFQNFSMNSTNYRNNQGFRPPSSFNNRHNFYPVPNFNNHNSYRQHNNNFIPQDTLN